MKLYKYEADLCVEDDGEFFNCLNACVLDHGARDVDYNTRCLSMKTFALSFIGSTEINKGFMIIENFSKGFYETCVSGL